MAPEQKELLNLHRLPGLLDSAQVSWRTNLTVFEIERVLPEKGILRPLGWRKLAKNGKKLWANVAVERFLADEAQMEAARLAIIDYWASKNSKRTSGFTESTEATPIRSSRDSRGPDDGASTNFPARIFAPRLEKPTYRNTPTKNLKPRSGSSRLSGEEVASKSTAP